MSDRDVTEQLAKHVFQAVEILLAGFEAAASRGGVGDGTGWLQPALDAEDDHFYQGVLSVVMRLVFLLYAEDHALLPIEHRVYAEHLSLDGLYARLSLDASAQPESMQHRFGAYGQLLALFRAVFFGVEHGSLEMPPRRGRLFDPNTYPFLEGGLPGWTSAADARPPSIDDGTIYRVLHRLVVFGGQRLSYRTLDVVQMGSVYESLMGYHVQRLESGLVLQPGEERRRTGTHYTPPSLTTKVVRRTLEPLLACLGEARTPEQILQLKICDPAMGSGAFLMAACDELAREIVAAWTRQGELARVIEQYGDAHLHARKLVAQRCLYGVDRNPAAVELAKLSLWLFTMSRTLPFTFVDHALRHGDSLVGLDLRQIEAFHWAPSGQTEVVRVLVRNALEQAATLRKSLLALADHEDPASQAEKQRRLALSHQAIARVRTVADACVGAFFAEVKDAARKKERKRRLALVVVWLGQEKLADDARHSAEEHRANAKAAAVAREELEAVATEAREKLSPFHWWIEFPEVFFQAQPDPLDGGQVTGATRMEAVVGNPPFAGKNTLIDSQPAGYGDWLRAVHSAAHGNSDLSAHFFRRAATLLGAHGAFGLIATNTIAQGDTRTTGLAVLAREGWKLYDATDSMPWPGAAAVTVSLVHGARGHASRYTHPVLNGRPVTVINSRLRAKPERPDPSLLARNASSSFQGSILLGMGFTLTPAERDALVKKNPKNAERIFPYINGVEVTTSPTHLYGRHAISFGQMGLADAERWPDLLRIVRERVKPERDRNNREKYRKLWWLFGEYRPGMFAALTSLDRCLVTAISGKHRVFAWQPTDRILDQTLIVFPLAQATQFAILQSRVHEAWSIELSGTIKEDQRYNPSRAFETFPFPQPDPRAIISDLESVGDRLYSARAKRMVDTDKGLTKTYNALEDPTCDDARVLELRRLHEEMDRAVLAAYGWSDIALPPYCPLTDEDREALQAFEDEVIDRLYVLNAERAREELRLGLTGKKKGRAESR